MANKIMELINKEVNMALLESCVTNDKDYVNLRGTDLDNALYELQCMSISNKEIRELLHKADVAYLQDREKDAAELVQKIHDLLK